MNNTGVGAQGLQALLHRLRFQRGFMFGALIVGALLAFEIFNYSTTDYALTDLLGDLRFMGVRWATILALAFCGIDFAGIARLFTPDQSGTEQNEVWYLFGAWMLAATMNATLTWWGVSLAVLNHETLGSAMVERGTLLRVVPIFVAIMVWLCRVLIIGTFSAAGDRLFNSQPTNSYRPPIRVSSVDTPAAARTLGASQRPSLNSQTRNSIPATTSFRPASNRQVQRIEDDEEYRNDYRQEERPQKPDANYNRGGGYSRPEPTYHPASMSGRQDSNNNNNNNATRR